MVSDFGPGHDAEGAFQLGFKEAGGEIVGSVRFPVANPDFSAFVQRAKDSNPDAIYILDSGRHAAGGGRQGARRARHRPEEDDDPGPGRARRRKRAQEHGRHRDRHRHRRALRLQSQVAAKGKAFVKAFHDDYKRYPDIFSIGGYDGMHLIYETLKKTGGKTDGDSLIAAAKGMKWESPRGPVSDRSGDARHHSDRLHPQGREGRRRPAQRRDRQGRERQGSGEGADEIRRRSRRLQQDNTPSCRPSALGRADAPRSLGHVPGG